ncbi:hypothetical protein JZO86_00760 [Enterococcus ureasiticus]|uniref:hypothetical protein n=1 Tax=Enterococcus ureasiticus TaxID=903984 RepID=UPI001A8E9F8E|nr:hypothetical protein [Enterococcus ureasiticus]MBO0472242.1 hypothetical protein [Enterococcus ureasiticus]
MKKILLGLIFTTILLAGGAYNTTNALAAEELLENNTIEDTVFSNEMVTYDEYSIIDDNGDTIIFNNKEDYDFYINYEAPKKIQSRSASTGTTWKTSVTSSTRKNQLWIGYHSGTPSWSKASSYTLTRNKTYSVSGSYKYEGVTMNIGFSYSKGVNTTIPADKKRNSRLGLWGDFTFRTIKTVEYRNGKATGNVQYRKDKIRHNYYINPKYQ